MSILHIFLKRNTIPRIKIYLNSDENILLLNSVVKSQFSYPPLIWMFILRYLKNELNSIREQVLHVIFYDSTQF